MLELQLQYCFFLQALITAVNGTTEEDIRDALKTQTENQLALVRPGPQLVKDTVAYNTTVTTDDTVNNTLFFFLKINVVRRHLVKTIKHTNTVAWIT